MTSLELYTVLLKDNKNVTKLSILCVIYSMNYFVFSTHRSTQARAFIVLKRLLFTCFWVCWDAMQCNVGITQINPERVCHLVDLLCLFRKKLLFILGRAVARGRRCRGNFRYSHPVIG